MAVKSESAAQLIARPSSHKILPTPVTVTGVSFASTGWLGLAFVCTACLVVAASFPYWTVNDSPQSSVKAINIKVGLFYFCYTPGTGSDPSIEEECHSYLGNSTNLGPVDMDDISFLFTSSVIYFVGAFLLALSLVVGVVAYCKPRIREKSVFMVAFVIQLFACVFLVSSLVLWPLMYHSDFARQFCGSSDYYIRGRCEVDWGCILAMVATSISLYLPALAIFSMNISDGLRAYKCC